MAKTKRAEVEEPIERNFGSRLMHSGKILMQPNTIMRC